MRFDDDDLLNPAHVWGGCACHGGSRRAFTGLLAAGLAAPGLALAQEEGVRVKQDGWAMRQAKKVISAEQVERAGAQQYMATLQKAQQQRALLPSSHPQVQRLAFIAERILPHAPRFNPRAAQWKWEVNIIDSPQVNAFCMPAGKIAFFSGILQKLQLSDDEVATIMGHEVAHALQEHARERMAQDMAARLGVTAVSVIFGLGDLGQMAAGTLAQLGTMKFGRGDESEADLVGMELAARAGYDPAAGVTLWQKMGAVSKGAPPEFLSTHPSGPTRIRDIEANLPKVAGLYQRAAKPPRRFGPPAAQG